MKFGACSLLALLVIPSVAEAQKTCTPPACMVLDPVYITLNKPLPQDQVSEETLVWVSRALVSEAGFKAKRDYATILWVLLKKWKRHTLKDNTTSFKDFVLSYCTGLHPDRINNRDHRWVQFLPANGETQPKGWSPELDWDKHKILWANLLTFVKYWAAGYVQDPCPRATDWAAPYVDIDPNVFVAVSCGNTKNSYYSLRRA